MVKVLGNKWFLYKINVKLNLYNNSLNSLEN